MFYFFVELEHSGTAITVVNYAIENYITYFPCVFDAEKNTLDCMWCELALTVGVLANTIIVSTAINSVA